ncbi:hypothetical protein [Pseudonocardia spinosispora]|uniref:hypothetical protein n=1 Tax=Pseudonocardia spinosispora TaxID=103441 RepID=UPI0012ECA578|nr:hypothetical protein [Pseudonocardia spinosispora]
MSPVDIDPVLACGRSAGYLRDLVADEATDGPEAARTHAAPGDLEHLDGCPYCAEQLALLRSQWTLVQRTAAAQVPVPNELISRTLATVNALRGQQSGDHVEIDQHGGQLRVRDRVIVLLARALAHDLLVEQANGQARVLAVRGDHDALTVEIALPYGTPIRVLAERLRLQLIDALGVQLGPAAPAVSVHVADLPRSTIG